MILKRTQFQFKSANANINTKQHQTNTCISNLIHLLSPNPAGKPASYSKKHKFYTCIVKITPKKIIQKGVAQRESNDEIKIFQEDGEKGCPQMRVLKEIFIRISLLQKWRHAQDVMPHHQKELTNHQEKSLNSNNEMGIFCQINRIFTFLHQVFVPSLSLASNCSWRKEMYE